MARSAFSAAALANRRASSVCPPRRPSASPSSQLPPTTTSGDALHLPVMPCNDAVLHLPSPSSSITVVPSSSFQLPVFSSSTVTSSPPPPLEESLLSYIDSLNVLGVRIQHPNRGGGGRGFLGRPSRAPSAPVRHLSSRHYASVNRPRQPAFTAGSRGISSSYCSSSSSSSSGNVVNKMVCNRHGHHTVATTSTTSSSTVHTTAGENGKHHNAMTNSRALSGSPEEVFPPAASLLSPLPELDPGRQTSCHVDGSSVPDSSHVPSSATTSTILTTIAAAAATAAITIPLSGGRPANCGAALGTAICRLNCTGPSYRRFTCMTKDWLPPLLPPTATTYKPSTASSSSLPLPPLESSSSSHASTGPHYADMWSADGCSFYSSTDCWVDLTCSYLSPCLPPPTPSSSLYPDSWWQGGSELVAATSVLSVDCVRLYVQIVTMCQQQRFDDNSRIAASARRCQFSNRVKANGGRRKTKRSAMESDSSTRSSRSGDNDTIIGSGGHNDDSTGSSSSCLIAAHRPRIPFSSMVKYRGTDFITRACWMDFCRVTGLVNLIRFVRVPIIKKNARDRLMGMHHNWLLSRQQQQPDDNFNHVRSCTSSVANHQITGDRSGNNCSSVGTIRAPPSTPFASVGPKTAAIGSARFASVPPRPSGPSTTRAPNSTARQLRRPSARSQFATTSNDMGRSSRCAKPTASVGGNTGSSVSNGTTATTPSTVDMVAGSPPVGGGASSSKRSNNNSGSGRSIIPARYCAWMKQRQLTAIDLENMWVKHMQQLRRSERKAPGLGLVQLWWMLEELGVLLYSTLEQTREAAEWNERMAAQQHAVDETQPEEEEVRRRVGDDDKQEEEGFSCSSTADSSTAVSAAAFDDGLSDVDTASSVEAPDDIFAEFPVNQSISQKSETSTSNSSTATSTVTLLSEVSQHDGGFSSPPSHSPPHHLRSSPHHHPCCPPYATAPPQSPNFPTVQQTSPSPPRLPSSIVVPFPSKKAEPAGPPHEIFPAVASPQDLFTANTTTSAAHRAKQPSPSSTASLRGSTRTSSSFSSSQSLPSTPRSRRPSSAMAPPLPPAWETAARDHWDELRPFIEKCMTGEERIAAVERLMSFAVKKLTEAAR
eukprot:GHVS01050256.1.p1 GENE.GHVS01050256.1~~GHVS01050256.1.p1  ORF type:complete len:1152 (+),score=294.43 GHVS01050256.1:133-3456(+)